MIEARIVETTQGFYPEQVRLRRDLHRYPEIAWTEFRTASLIARRLHDLGWSLQLGPAVFKEESRMGVPSPEELEACYQRAAREGADPQFLPAFRGGYTGLVATLKGGKPGPTVGIRVDIDCLPIEETTDPQYQVNREGYRSTHPGLMHACGHDGHAAIGVGLAVALKAIQPEIHGTVKLIFQPGEEGGRGGKPMTDAGVVDDVDYFFGVHLGLGEAAGTVYGASEGYLASTKLDAHFTGRPAHAGGRPEEGRNAILAAAAAVTNLYAISRHSGGATRINVGVVKAGSGRNIIPDKATLIMETRGYTTELNAYMEQRARQVLEGAARMHDCGLEIRVAGQTATAVCDQPLVELVQQVARRLPGVTRVPEHPHQAGGSEDATFMMRRVQERGGLATYIGVCSEVNHGHHTYTFDFQEDTMLTATRVLALAAYRAGVERPRRG